LAGSRPIEAVGFFSSFQNEDGLSGYAKKLVNTPTLLIAAEQDSQTFASAKTIFEMNQNDASKLIAYKGAEHGYPLFEKDSQLADVIALWFKQRLATKQ
tara:strand:- start:242 stop:538 length:297 start_codon:yes stop_codon:yes gene_type:complete